MSSIRHTPRFRLCRSLAFSVCLAACGGAETPCPAAPPLRPPPSSGATVPSTPQEEASQDPVVPPFDGLADAEDDSGSLATGSYNDYVAAYKPGWASDPLLAAIRAVAFDGRESGKASTEVTITVDGEVVTDPPPAREERAEVRLERDALVDATIRAVEYKLVFTRHTSRCGAATCEGDPIPWRLESAVRACKDVDAGKRAKFDPKSC